MYKSRFGLKQNPFSLLPDPGFLYLGDVHAMAYTMLEYGLLNNAGIIVITGEVGSGKTTLVRHLLNELDEESTVGLISNTHRSFDSLFEWVLFSFGLDYKDRGRVELYERFVEFVIAEYARGQRTILIVDEAQNMEPDSLEDLRLLSNINADNDQLFQLILVGQPALRETLQVPELVQFAQRVAVDYHIGPLDATETAAYIAHRLSVAGGDSGLIEPAAREVVYRYSNGIPRLINLLCDTALVYAFGSRDEVVTAATIEEVVRDKRRGGLLTFGAEGAKGQSDVVRAEPVHTRDGVEVDATPLRPSRTRSAPVKAVRGPAEVLDEKNLDGELDWDILGVEELDSELQTSELRELFGSLRER